MSGEEKKPRWSSDPQWNAEFLARCLQILVNSPAAGAFMKATLAGQHQFLMADAVKTAEELATGILEVAAGHTQTRNGRELDV